MPLLRGLGPSRDNQRHERSGLGGVDHKPGESPIFRGHHNECGEPDRRPDRTDRPFGGLRGDSDSGGRMGDFRRPRFDDQRSSELRPDNDCNEENRYRQDDGPGRPHHRRDRRSLERDGSHGRDIRDDHHWPSPRSGSLNREHPIQTKDHKLDLKSDSPKVDSADPKSDILSLHRAESQIKSPALTESVSGHSKPGDTSLALDAKPEEEKRQEPRTLKPALLPTPPKGPLRPLFSSRGRGRGRGGPRR